MNLQPVHLTVKNVIQAEARRLDSEVPESEGDVLLLKVSETSCAFVHTGMYTLACMMAPNVHSGMHDGSKCTLWHA